MIRTITSMFFMITLAIAAPAYSAAYMKFDGVKGESKGQANAPSGNVKSNETPKPAGMLVPAVQKATDGGAKKKGNVEFEWKVEKGEK